MTHYIKSGTRFSVSANAAMDLYDLLPAATYTVKFNEMSGTFYLEMVEDFEFGGKVYGDTIAKAERILATFNIRPNSTGVMLTGDKGGGKTLLAKMISIIGRKSDIPTIVINQPWHGEEFNGFMQTIEQPTIVIFDEFEKVYNNEQQERMLTLLDGVYSSRKLFIITCNDKYRVNDHMKNRPGRIFYRLDYTGLEREFIVEYCEDNLKNKDHIETICRIAAMFSSFNFDILKAIVEEMNRYGETPQQALQMLNAKPELSDASKYKIILEVAGKLIPAEAMYPAEWSGNPLNNGIHIRYRPNSGVPIHPEEDTPVALTNEAFEEELRKAITGKKGRKKRRDDDDDEFEDEWVMAEFTPSHLSMVDSTSGKFLFVNEKGEKLGLTKVEPKSYNWDAF